jgi:hypothetical protein
MSKLALHRDAEKDSPEADKAYEELEELIFGKCEPPNETPSAN